MKRLALIIIGLGEGLIVGSALIAFLLVLDVIPRLIRFSQAKQYIVIYKVLIISGVVLAINLQFYQLSLPNLLLVNQLWIYFWDVYWTSGRSFNRNASGITDCRKEIRIKKRITLAFINDDCR